jgi:putative hydrolase of the HAD superfamily
MTENHLKPIQSYTCLLVDLDDTLYHHENGAWEMIRARIDRFMIEEMGFSPQDVPSIRQRLWEQYGTTLRGLQTEFSVDMDAYLDFVHDVPLEKIIEPEPALDNLFTILPHQKHIFTNAHAVHARRVLSLLGISQHFDNIIDIFAIQPYCKPQAEAFNKALAIIKEDPRNCLLIDDSPGNLATAQSLGMGTVSVGKHRHNGSPHINQILELSNLLSKSS